MTDRRIGRRGALKVAGGGALAGLAGLAGPAVLAEPTGLAEAAGRAPESARHATQHGDLLLTAARMFDGTRMRENTAVHVRGTTIAGVGPAARLATRGARRIDLGDGTLLPGFIDLHVHVTLRGVPFDRVLTHGVTTVRDVGGFLPSRYGGPGQLRYLAAGPIITTPGGYPIPLFGSAGSTAVRGTAQARQAVRDHVRAGAALIKIALEPGGEPGAPWSQEPSNPPPPWPMLSVDEVAAIVDEAHRHDRIVTVHLAEEQGVRRALDAGVDELAHSPSNPVPDSLLAEVARRGVPVVSTLDTESHGTGQLANARTLVAAGATLLYGTDMGHLEIPDGFDAEELMLMTKAGLSLEEALAAATAKAGAHLGLAPLGSIVPGAPADMIGVLGDPAQNLKNLEYPELVIAAGRIVTATLIA